MPIYRDTKTSTPKLSTRQRTDRAELVRVTGNTVLQPGDHLVSSRTAYDHHGIFVGGGFVIHYLGLANGLSSGPIAQTSLEEFQAGHTKLYRQPHAKNCFAREEIVSRAESRLGEERYSLVFNNCEHFANWCVNGEAVSEQVRGALDVIVTIASSTPQGRPSAPPGRLPTTRPLPPPPVIASAPWPQPSRPSTGGGSSGSDGTWTTVLTVATHVIAAVVALTR